MTRWYRIIPAVAVALLLGACGQDSDSPMSPSAPRFDGGYIVGGNAEPPPPPPDSVASAGEGAVLTDTTSRGGYIVGGN